MFQSFQLSRFGLLRGALAVSSFSLLSSFSPPAWEVSVRSVLVFFSTFASTLACRRRDLVMSMNVNEKYPHEINMNEHEIFFTTYRFLPAEYEPKENCHENNHNGCKNSNSQIWLLLPLFNDFLQRSIKYKS